MLDPRKNVLNVSGSSSRMDFRANPPLRAL